MKKLFFTIFFLLIIFSLKNYVFAVQIISSPSNLNVASDGQGDPVLYSSGYFDVNCPPNGVCPTSGLNDYWAGVLYNNNIRVTTPSVSSTFQTGDNVNINWRLGASGSTGMTAYLGFEVRYSLDGSNLQTVDCINPTLTGVSASGGVKYICMDQKKYGKLPNFVIGAIPNLSGSTYVQPDFTSPRSVAMAIPNDWGGRKVKFQVIEKFCQGVGSTCDTTHMYLTSYSGEYSITRKNVALPPLDINPIKISTACSNLGGRKTDRATEAWDVSWCNLDPNQCMKEGKLITFTDPRLSTGYTSIALFASINNSPYYLVGETSNQRFLVSSGQPVLKIYSTLSDSQKQIILFDAKNKYWDIDSDVLSRTAGVNYVTGREQASPSVLLNGDTIKYKIYVYRWDGVIGAGGQQQSQTFYSESIKYDVPHCLVDNIVIDPAQKIFDYSNILQSQKFTAIANFKPLLQPLYYTDINICLDPANVDYYNTPSCIEERLIYNNHTPSQTVVTDYVLNSSKWSIDSTILGSLAGSTFSPIFTDQKQTGKINYDYNFRPYNAVSNALEALNPGSNMNNIVPWLQKIKGSANITINTKNITNNNDNNNNSDNNSSSKSSVFKGIFIGQGITLPNTSGRDMTIEYDSNIVDNPPPGFGDLIAPNWGERVP